MTRAPAPELYDVLDETQDDVVAIRVGRGTKRGHEELYSLLAETTWSRLRVLVESARTTVR